MAAAQDLLPPDAASLLRRTLEEIQRGAGSGLLSIGAAVALWGASRGMVSIITTLNVVYGVTNLRPWWRRQLVALALTVGFSVLALAALLSVVFGERSARRPRRGQGWAAPHGGLGSPPVAARRPVHPHGDRSRLPSGARRPPALVLAHARIRLRGRRLGGGLARPPRLRQPVANYNATYGSIGGVILLLLWLYLSGMALLIGGEVNSVIARAAAERGEEIAAPLRRARLAEPT